jgi:amidase
MKLDEYAAFDALGLAHLIAVGEVSPREVARVAMQAIEAINPRVNAVVETYADRIEALDESSLGDGPFRGVPFLMKDVFGHEAGRKIEFGSRLCEGMVAEADSAYCRLVKAAGVNVIGRSAAPEYSMSGTTEGAFYGNTSNPWREGFSAGGSTGGGMAAVVAGMVPIAQGSDIGGSIRIPASFCGGVGLKPSRGRVSFAPMLDENGYGLAQTFVQTKTVRDAAAMLDCVAKPQVGDPFRIPRPDEPWSVIAERPAKKLRIGWSTAALMGFPVDPEVADAVVVTAQALADMGHDVDEVTPSFDGLKAMQDMMGVWFFGLDARLEGYARKTGRTIGPDTLEPVVLKLYAFAKTLTPAHFIAAMGALNGARRGLGTVFVDHDVWITPSTPRTSESWGRYNLGRDDVEVDALAEQVFRPTCQFALPHNIMGTPAISLPLAVHSNGLPIGVQVSAGPADEHLVLQIATMLEKAMPWFGRRPPLHVTTSNA